MMGEWWSSPRSIDTGTEIWTGGMATDGSVIIASDSARLDLGTAIPDDHCSPSLLLEADKPPIVMWNHHGKNSHKNLYLRKGTTPQDLTALGSAQTITLAVTGGVSYQQIYRTGANELTVFTRWGTGNRNWGFIKSTDWGDTWSSPVTLLDFGANQQGYMTSCQVSDVIRVAAYGHPSASTIHDVFYFEIHSDGAIKDTDGVTIANTNGTNLPLTPGTMTPVYEAPVGSLTRLFEVSAAAEPEIAIATWTTLFNQEYKYLRRVAGTWVLKDIVPTGDPFGNTADRSYLGGMYFAETQGELFLAREDADVWYLEKYVTADSGNTWAVEEVSTNDNPLARPVVPKNATLRRVVWSVINYYTSYTTYNASLVGEL